MADAYINLSTRVGIYSDMSSRVTGWVVNGVLEFKSIITEFGKITIYHEADKYIDEVGNIVIRKVCTTGNGVHRLVRLVTIIHNWVRRGR